MSVDSWNWKVEGDADQDRNNGWAHRDLQQNSKNAPGYRNNTGTNNNSQQSQIGQVQLSGLQNNQRTSNWSQPNNPHNESTTDYFLNRGSLNNNPFPDVENKEIAPPDHHHHSTGSRHPMKLGNKQTQLQNSAIKNRQDNSSHFNYGQHGSSHQQHGSSHQQHGSSHQQHGSSHQQHHGSYMQQNIGPSRNSTHHYFSNIQDGMLRPTDDQSGGNTWSYFDAMGGSPSLTGISQPQSLPPTDVFQERSPHNEPKNFSYFHPTDNSPASLGANSEPTIHSSQFSGFCKEDPNLKSYNVPTNESTSQHTSKELNQYHPFHEGRTQTKDQSQNHMPDNLFSESTAPPTNNNLFDKAKISEESGPPLIHEERVPVQESLSSNISGSVEKLEQPLPHSHNCEPQSAGLDLAPQMLPPPQKSQSRVEQDKTEAQAQEWPAVQDIPTDHLKTHPPYKENHPQESFGFVPNASVLRLPDRATVQNYDRPDTDNLQNYDFHPHPPQNSDNLPPHSGDWPLMQQSSQSVDLPLQQPPDNAGSQNIDWRLSQTPDRPLSQTHDWPKTQQMPERMGPHRYLPQQPERPLSQGRDTSGSLPPLTDKASSQGHKMSGFQSKDRPGSQGCDWSSPASSERASTHEKMGHNRTPSQESDRSGSLGRVSNVRMDDKTEDIANRSPGSGQDRCSPPTRPDNMESLPPDPHITHQMKQLSIQPQMGDCPLDRNEYLETSQLSNQESGSNDIRPSRHQQSDSNLASHRGERREVVGEAEPLGGRVVVGHTTPNATPPPNHSDEVEGGGSGSMERMVVGERRDQSSRNNRTSRLRNHHRRESSFEEDDPDYSSDNRRGPRDDYRREDRHRKKRGQDNRSPDYPSDEDYEIDRRAYSRRDRRGRERDYSPEYRRDYYRDDHRRVVRGTRERDYYRYEDDDYSFRERSRPSSRSGSDYRRTNLEYNSRNSSRHYYNPSLAGMLGGRDYESNPEYFEMMRKNNPLLYAYWYQEYIMRKLQDPGVQSTFTQSDRASIHSGQSSGNRMNISTPNQALDSNIGNVDSFEEYSPRLFSTPHVRGSYDGQGRLIAVDACNPLDGQHASVKVLALQPQDLDSDIEEFLHSPGPFIPGVTHRSSVLQYLRKMSDQAEKNSEKLLYDLVHLIVKSNGKPDATDISELLLESYRSNRGDSRDQWDPDPTLPKPISHQDMLARFRSLLHQGNKQEALDWAMRNGGWGHALYLASKMDIRTQNRVNGEFARSIAPSDPLSSLYQVMSGNIPAAATACTDRRWADWRPHLAMLLSNLTDKASIDFSTITTLADGLASRGRIYAAHSCYLIAQVIFGEMCKTEGPVLLGWYEPVSYQPNSLQNEPSVETFSYKSFLLTLCYEYAVKQSQPNFYIPDLQKYKLLIAWRLVEWNRGREALLYCELLAGEILRGSPASISPLQYADLIHLLIDLSSSLKILDPLAPPAAIELSSSPDADWLQQLKQLVHTLPQHNMEPLAPSYHQPEPTSYSNFEPQQHVPVYSSGGFDGGFVTNQINVEEPSMINEAVELPTSSSTPGKPASDMYPTSQRQQHQLPQQHLQQPIVPTPVMLPTSQQPTSLPSISAPVTYSSSTFSAQPQSYTGYDDRGSTEVDHGGTDNVIQAATWEPEPEISSQTAVKTSTSYFQASDNILQGVGDNKPAAAQPISSTSEIKNKSEPISGGGGNNGGSWFGGIFGKLSMKPKNAANKMVLPDDKDPKIVFDEKLKQWVDKDNEGGEGAKEMKTLPTGNPGIPLVGGIKPVSNPPSNPGIPLTNPGDLPSMQHNTINKYKLQRGKSMKSNYVDILSTTGGSSKVNSNMDSLIPSMGPNPVDPTNPNYFLPQSAENKGNYSSQVPGDNNYHGQLSRSSSMSSLSREVSHYMEPSHHHRSRPTNFHHSSKMSSRPGPALYNPANYKS